MIGQSIQDRGHIKFNHIGRYKINCDNRKQEHLELDDVGWASLISGHDRVA
jgi:hypothetical protein